jgi:murein tripeptide amidase MpaA
MFIFFFQKKKQKALFRFAETHNCMAQETIWFNGYLLFPEKEAKSVCSASRKNGYILSKKQS